jgi:surface protein
MSGMFAGTTSLKSVPLFDTRNVTNMSSMFGSLTDAYTYHSAIEHVPLFDTSKVTDMHDMFYYAVDVIDGALALYQQASSQSTPPVNYSRCFRNCGEYTPTGSAELAQIPSDWK